MGKCAHLAQTQPGRPYRPERWLLFWVTLLIKPRSTKLSTLAGLLRRYRRHRNLSLCFLGFILQHNYAL